MAGSASGSAGSTSGVSAAGLASGGAEPIAFVVASALPRPRRSRWGVAPAIAIVAVDDTITSGASRSLPLGLGGEAGAETIVRALDEAERDADVKAVVLRVESPGGDALASELIARRVARLAKLKPVIASLGGVAASGGYYVAAPATTILAEPTTITGSIGVFNLGFSVEGLARALGVHAETVQRGVGDASRLVEVIDDRWPMLRQEGQRPTSWSIQTFKQMCEDHAELPLPAVVAGSTRRSGD
jgi:ClpP class serine protease